VKVKNPNAPAVKRDEDWVAISRHGNEIQFVQISVQDGWSSSLGNFLDRPARSPATNDRGEHHQAAQTIAPQRNAGQF
jgi:hypothetical protein